MKYIKLTNEQAEAIKGRHGIYSEIVPILTEIGYLIPEDVLFDEDLTEINGKIQSFITDSNVIDYTFSEEVEIPIVIDEIQQPTLEQRVADIEQVTEEVITALNDKGIVP